MYLVVLIYVDVDVQCFTVNIIVFLINECAGDYCNNALIVCANSGCKN